MSRRNTELVFLALAAVISTMAYVSVFAGRYHEIRRASIVYGLIFVAVFLVLHLVVRFVLPQADPCLLPITALLAAMGLTEIYRIKPALALLQGQWLLVGAGLFILTVVIVRDHQRLDRYRYVIGAVGLGLLLLTMVVGTEVNGARLWLRFAGLSIQPSEFAKIAIVIFMAGYLNDKKELLSMPTKRVLGLGDPGAQVLRSAGAHVGADAGHAGLHQGLRHVAAVLRRVRGDDVHGHLAHRLRHHGGGAVRRRRRRSPRSTSPTCTTVSSSG